MKKDGLTEAEARERAAEMSVSVYSPSQHDSEQYPELVEHQIAPEDVTPKIVPKFLDPDDPLRFVIVCNKLLTGFDAPIEQAMYLDNPLTDHSLLHAIARTNRRYGTLKDHGLIVDYIGVSKKLDEAWPPTGRKTWRQPCRIRTHWPTSFEQPTERFWRSSKACAVLTM